MFKLRASSFFQGEIITKYWKSLTNLKIVFSRTTGLISTKFSTKHPWVKGIQVCSNEGPHPFPRGDNCEIVKIHWQYLKIFFSRTTEPFSTKLGTKHPWMNGFQICSNEGPCSFSRGDNYKMVKIHWRNLENLLLKNHWANFNQTWHKPSFDEGYSNLFKWRAPPFSKGRLLRNSKNTLTKFKNLLLQNHWAIFNQTWHKASLGEGDSSL